MKKAILMTLVISLTVLMAATFVSAFWPFSSSISGNVIEDQTTITNIQGCSDSDNGVFTNVGGVVIYYSGWTGAKGYPDLCSGKATTIYDSEGKAIKTYPSISESYCDSTGKVKSQLMGSDVLGEGYCVQEAVTITLNNQEKKFTSAKWVEKETVCIPITNGVMDESGNRNVNGCGTGTNSNMFTSYSCEENQKVPTTTNCSTADGLGRCTPQGCTGTCTETDSANDASVPGAVTANGIVYKDNCSVDRNSVIQYMCENGVKKTVTSGQNGFRSCGVNRECALDSTGTGYCKDKYAGTETIETLTAKVNSLEERIGTLETQLSTTFNTEVLELLNRCEVKNDITFDSGTLTDSKCDTVCQNIGKKCISGIMSWHAASLDASRDFTNTRIEPVECNTNYPSTHINYLSCVCC